MMEILTGGGMALGLIAASYAVLPREPAPQQQAARSATKAAPAPRPATPAEPPALIAFQTPTPGYPVISPFGLRQLPWEEGGRLHAGVDIAAPAGQPVLVAADGVVVRAGVGGGYGRFVEVKHAAGLSTIYAHMGRLLPEITAGVAVKAGTPVGEIGSSGTSTGAHLHFEIRDQKDRPLNPELFLGRRFAEAADLPLRAAQRFPRAVRVAYVSNIPKAKREEMEARLKAELEAELAEAAASEAAKVQWTSGQAAPAAAPNVGDAAVDVAEVAPQLKLKNGRPHARLRVAPAEPEADAASQDTASTTPR